MKRWIIVVFVAVAFYAPLSVHASPRQDVLCSSDGTARSAASGNPGAIAGHFCQIAQDTTGASAPSQAPRAMLPNDQSVLDIRHPSFAGGAVCDGSTDIGPALQAAWNALPAGGGAIQIVGTSASPCYWANPTKFTWTSHALTSLYIQGQLRVGTTLTIPNGVRVNLIGKGGANPAQFQAPGETASIRESPINNIPIKGTLRTAVTSIGVATTFTPSSMNGLYPGTAITVVGMLTCNITSLKRSGIKVTAKLSGPCHIPAGVRVTVAGVADSSFNGSYVNSRPFPFLLISSDYVLNTLTWRQNGADASSSGGTVTGLNEDNIENVQITATTSKTATATFARPHDPSDQFAAVGININQPNSASKIIRDLTIAADGTALWLQQDYLTRLEHVGITAAGACSANPASWPIELGDASFITMDGVAFDGACLPWSMRLTQPYRQGYTGSGPIYLSNSFVMSGIKLDHGASGVFIKNTVIEQATRGAVVIDPTNYWNGNKEIISIENSGLQDNPYGFRTCFVYYETPVYGAGLMRANVALKHLGSSSCMVNDYFSGAINTEFPNGSAAFGQNNPRGVLGTYNDGKTIEAELRGEQAGLSPAVIPYQTLPVNTNPSSWSGTCTVTTGALAPDGTATAGALTAASAGSIYVENYTVKPSVGDMILYGGWVHSPTLGKTAQGGRGGDAFHLDNGNSHFQFDSGNGNNTNIYDSVIVDDWWHPVVGFTSIAGADGSNGNVRMALSCDQNKTLEYWQPFMIYIPAAANIPLSTVMRWRQQLLHGVVPANWNKPGVAVTTEPIAMLPASQTIDGTSGTATCSQGLQGTQKYVSCYLNGYAQKGKAQTYTFPAAFSTTPILLESGGSCGTYNPSATTTKLILPASVSMTGETCNVAVLGQ